MRLETRPELAEKWSGTYEFLVLATVLNPDVRLASLIEDLEGEVLDIGLDFCVGELSTNETLGIEHAEVTISTVID